MPCPATATCCWTPWQAFSEALGVVAAMLQTWHEERASSGGRAIASPVRVSHARAAPSARSQAACGSKAAVFARRTRRSAAAAAWARRHGDSHHGPLQHHLPQLAELLQQTHLGFAASLPARGATPTGRSCATRWMCCRASPAASCTTC